MHAQVMSQPLQKQIEVLEPLCAKLMAQQNDPSKKLEYIQQLREVRTFLSSSPFLEHYLNQLDLNHIYVFHCLIAINQGHVVFDQMDKVDNPIDLLLQLGELLVEVENFYQPIGGIVGYHLTMLRLISEKEKGHQDIEKNLNYYHPEGIDLIEDQSETNLAVRWGIENLPLMAEIYPLGGAADRLQLRDEKTGEPLPSAQLLFLGRPLLTGLIRDLQGREFLYYKLCGKQSTTPIAIMTSHEKNNHERVTHLLKNHNWFDRPQESFRLFIQPMVPMVTVQGNWVVSAPLKVVFKPGGHGVIWKKAIDSGTFDWLEKQQRKKALVRQINNPVAGIDNGLLALSGIGCHQDKAFGFASCLRRLNTSEGMNVLIEKKTSSGYEYRITNIEYTDFEQKGIKDIPAKAGSPYSCFPANTNILFIDLEAIKNAVKIDPIPGMLINMKASVTCKGSEANEASIQAGRLESTMQNIVDVIVDRFPSSLEEGHRNELQTFLTYNLRRKTISVTKESYSGKSLMGTPPGCFYELMQNYFDLLTINCQMKLPPLSDEKNYLEEGPSFLVDFHPGLGGLYSVISQKIRGGSLGYGSEWIMEIAEANIENLELEGSLHILANQVLGHKEVDGTIKYSSQCGKCTFRNVAVKNQGIDRTVDNCYWKKEIVRKECLLIILQGNAEILAENVTFMGDVLIEVPDGHRLTVSSRDGEPHYHLEKISAPTWQWRYSFDESNLIKLSEEALSPLLH